MTFAETGAIVKQGDSQPDTQMKNKFFNKDGTITSYSFLCGYVEKYGQEIFPRATISREANGYHIKGYDENDSHFWEIREKVKDARAFARKNGGKLKKASN